MSILSGRKVETPAPGSVGSFGGWRDPKELESRADFAFKYFGSATDLADLEARDGFYINSAGSLLIETSGDPLALNDPGDANVDAWARRDDGTVLFLRRPHRNEPATVTELDHKLAADKRATVDAEKARIKFLRGQTLQPVMRKADGPAITLRNALEAVEHHEGRVELGPYGEVQVLLPPVLTAPTQTPPASTPATPTPLPPPRTIRSTRRRQGVTPTRRSR
jgi:hypothetical protein